MALQVWLPLNGDLKNRGLANVTVTNNGAVVDNSGKIGKCYSFDGNSNYILSELIAKNDLIFSFGGWVNLTENRNGYYNYIISLGNGNGYAGQQFCLTYENNTINYTIGGTSNTYSYTLSLNTWYHLFVTVDGVNAKLYVNGELKNASTGIGSIKNLTKLYIGFRYGGSSTHYFKGKLNDIRIYDHCLSSAEIKEISKGLVLHYPLNNLVQPNLLLNPDTNYFMNSGTDYPNNVTVSYRMEDGYSVVKIQRKATSGSCYFYGWYQTRISQFPYKPNTKYTISGDIRSNCSGYFFFDTRGSSHNSGKVYFTSTNGEWKRFSATWTTPSNCTSDTSALSLIGLDTGSDLNNYAEIRKCKIEEGDVATPYGEDINVVYDCSGYGNNGTVVGNLLTTTDSKRYDRSSKLSDSATSIQTVNLASLIHDGYFSMSIWFKKTTGEWSSKSWETIFGGPSGFEYQTKNGSTNSPNLWAYSWGNVSVSTYTCDEWHHTVMVRTPSDCKFYLDGVLKYTGSAGSIPSGNYFFGAWSTSTGQNYRGCLSDARIYATALSADEVLELYNTSAKITKNGTLMCYELKEE